MKNTYIIILNYNCWQYTVDCIQSVRNHNLEHVKIVVVDNNSMDNSTTRILSYLNNNLYHGKIIKEFDVANNNDLKKIQDTFSEEIIVLQTGENLGFAQGYNTAIKNILKIEPSEFFIWLLNPDMIVEKDSLTELIKCFGKAENKIIGSTVKCYYHKTKILFRGGFKINTLIGAITPITNKNDINKISYVSGGNLFTNSKTFEKIGLLPTDYFLYWEEADWCTKAKQFNIDLTYCENSISYDKGGASINRKSAFAEYYYSRNALLFISKYYKSNIIFALLFLIFRGVYKTIFNNDKNFNARFHAMKDYLMDNRGVKLNIHQ